MTENAFKFLMVFLVIFFNNVLLILKIIFHWMWNYNEGENSGEK